MSKPFKKEFFFTPLGIVEPYAYLAKPDFGQGTFATERGKYKVNLTVPSDKAQPLMDKIVALYESDYAARLAEYKKNPPQTPKGKKPPKAPYQGDLPFIENDDGTVTFRFSSYDRFERDGEVVMKPLKVVDAKGKAIPSVPNISGGSEGKARFSMMAYGWSNVAGASVKLQLDSFMLVKLVEFGGGGDDWGDEVEEGGYEASDAPAKPKRQAEEASDWDGQEQDEYADVASDGDF
ncbi:single-stranded DNA-binding protein [Pseudomonas oryzihabitans]|uniref:single-stranded DNA-binding protein n=1 Tax=Pseudomonas oryzihabitans TaxID=47885 RepID=UPI0015E28296|nr:single-stranded DNA-binding protein [Pseudomonas psychrotolerans]MBA1211547.1 single-stranded DNA-binding protein [Pseudomonas psychrotolerans]